MKVVAILVNYQTAEMSCRAAAATVKRLCELDSEFRLYIVDNDSGGEDIELLESCIRSNQQAALQGWENVELLKSPENNGFGAGNNYAIEYAKSSGGLSEYYYFVNSDAFPEENSIRFLMNYLDSNQRFGIAGSYIHGEDGEPHTTAFRFPSIWSELESSVRLGVLTKILRKHVVPLGIPKETRRVDWLAGASMMVRREMLEEIGIFDEQFFLYFEETDLCKRAHSHGWDTVYVKDSSVEHIGSVSTGMKEIIRIPTYWLDSRRHYFIKNHGRFYFYAATCLRLIGECIWRLRTLIEKKKDPTPQRFITDLTMHTIGKK